MKLVILYIIRRKIFQRQSYRFILKLSIAIDVLLNNIERDKARKLDTWFMIMFLF